MAAGLTVMILLTEVSGLPQTSIAVHVSMTVPPHISGVAVNVDRSDVPAIRQPPPRLLVKLTVLACGMLPQATVILPGAVIAGKAAGLTVMVLLTEDSSLPQTSVAVHVSMTVPPHAPGVAVNVDKFEVPVIRHPPLFELVKLIVLGAGI
jgi:hypothetical protein